MSLNDAIIREINQIPKEGIRLKKFRKPILSDFTGENMTESMVKEKFAECLEKFCADGIVSLDGGILTKMKAGMNVETCH